MIGNALRADLGPVLMFAPRRKAAEDFATQLAATLPADISLLRDQTYSNKGVVIIAT